MTNKEKYKKAFSALHASCTISLEEEIMEKKKSSYVMKKMLTAFAAIAIVFGSMTAVYAADLGGIKEKLTLWFHGAQADVNVTDNGGGNYTFTFTDADGESHEMGGGGVAFDKDGNEIPLPADDVFETITNEVDKDGKIWLYYYDRQIEITNLFDDDGICRVAVKHDGNTAYFAIGRGGDYSSQIEAPADAERYTLVE